LRLVRVAGGPSASWESRGDRLTVGSDVTNDVHVDDATVSRFHCEVIIDGEGARVRDLRSRNGTSVDGLFVKEAYLRAGSTLKLGRTSMRCELPGELNRLPISERSEMGGLVGCSVAMRATFAVLERVAASNATVLIEGETGSGKGAVAEALHGASDRAGRPFVVLDVGALPPSLVESELFGHERGAFTGAVDRRLGVFEEASGGTVFLDEIGELPLPLQPKLLRVLEERRVRRVGANLEQPVDVRVIAATHRDLRVEVNEQRFRSDLYYRVAVVRVAIPPLRERLEDIPVLVDHLLAKLGADPRVAAQLRTPEFLRQLAQQAWPGNVRELRNHLERCLVLPESALAPAPREPRPAIDLDMPFLQARRRLVQEFERAYLSELLARNDGRPGAAAQAAGIDRVYLYRLLRKHGLR
jgi:DNA-binding NtrC family response regulator